MKLKFDPFAAIRGRTDGSEIYIGEFFSQQMRDANAVIVEASARVKDGDSDAQATVDLALETINAIATVFQIPGLELIKGNERLEKRDRQVALASFLAGYQVSQFAVHTNFEIDQGVIDEFKRLIASQTGKAAVSHRQDQKLKPEWIAHVQRCVANGLEIKNIDDLINVEGYPAELLRVLPKTLKIWAKEADKSIVFKRGRPAKK